MSGQPTAYELQPRAQPNAVATRETIPATEAAATALPHSPTPQQTLPATDSLLIGRSVEGQPLMARRFGTGERVLLLVGGMHGGWEMNTVELMDALIAHFEANPQDVLPEISILLLRAANVDGLGVVREEQGRFNAHGVDLNRNWGCGWSESAQWRDQKVDPGPAPLSEPETRALAALIENLRPAAVLFYHSAAGGVFAGRCDGQDHGSALLAEIVGRAADYSFGAPFTAYPVTGTAPSWVASLGIPSADVELESWTDIEFERNLRAVLLVQRWLLGN